MNSFLVSIYSVILVLISLSPCLIKAAQDNDPKDSVRISEVALDVGKMSSYTTFMFVEVYTSLKSVSLQSVTVVIYGASQQNIIQVCPCDNAVFNDLGYALCDCGSYGFETQEFVGAVGLHNADQSKFVIGSDASASSGINLIDAVLWQSYGSILPNPLQPYFALHQVFHYAPPINPSAYSINRCYGVPSANGKWQASFSWNETATPTMPNVCNPPPIVIINEMNFNKTFVELMTTAELPLDNVTIAFVSDVGSVPTVTKMYTLSNQRSESSTFFTMGKLGSDLAIPNWQLVALGPVAIVAYFNTTVLENTAAPPTNFLSSIVYDVTDGVTIQSLAIFGANTYAYDPTGKCSLSVCNGNDNDIKLTQPSFDAPNDCTKYCSAV